jgi:hypothetical protein
MIKKLFLIIAVFVSLACQAFGAFEEEGWGVRPIGMGEAFTAVADDSNGPMYNPAGAALMQKREATFMSSKLFTGLQGVEIGQNYFSYIEPLGKAYGTLGITWASLDSPALYREDTAVLTYARSLDDVFKSKKFSLMAGVNVKYLRHEYTLDAMTVNDPVFASGSSKDAMTYDAGVLLTFPKAGISLGYDSKNITSPDVGLKSPDIVTNESVVGIAYHISKLPVVGLPLFTIDFDVANLATGTDYRVGAETRLFKGRFPIRAGANNEEITAGIGYELPIGRIKLAMDYAFEMPLVVEQSTGSHRLGLTIKF